MTIDDFNLVLSVTILKYFFYFLKPFLKLFAILFTVGDLIEGDRLTLILHFDKEIIHIIFYGFFDEAP